MVLEYRRKFRLRREHEKVMDRDGSATNERSLQTNCCLIENVLFRLLCAKTPHILYSKGTHLYPVLRHSCVFDLVRPAQLASFGGIVSHSGKTMYVSWDTCFTKTNKWLQIVIVHSNVITVYIFLPRYVQVRREISRNKTIHAWSMEVLVCYTFKCVGAGFPHIQILNALNDSRICLANF